MHEVAQDWVVQAKTTLVEVERVLGQVIDEDDPEEEEGPARVLVVDDEASARTMMRSALEGEDYDVDEAEDGSRAVESLQDDPSFDLVILDLAMPELDGWGTRKWIRGNVGTAALPVMVRTGTGSEEIETELLRAGADDYVSKSVDAPRFLARVAAMIRRTRV
jgi:DNA-binding response OmpR family regulator